MKDVDFPRPVLPHPHPRQLTKGCKCPLLHGIPSPSGPPQRKPSSGASPWRSCYFTNVSGVAWLVFSLGSGLALFFLPVRIYRVAQHWLPCLFAAQAGVAAPGHIPLLWPCGWLLLAPCCPWGWPCLLEAIWDLCVQAQNSSKHFPILRACSQPRVPIVCPLQDS